MGAQLVIGVQLQWKDEITAGYQIPLYLSGSRLAAALLRQPPAPAGGFDDRVPGPVSAIKRKRPSEQKRGQIVTDRRACPAPKGLGQRRMRWDRRQGLGHVAVPARLTGQR